ncbi:5825_t:CDS:1, partial [Scutellospora calospora]
NYEENTKSTNLAIESENAITKSAIADRLYLDIELKLFLFNNTSFNKAHEFVEVEEEEKINILKK